MKKKLGKKLGKKKTTIEQDDVDLYVQLRNEEAQAKKAKDKLRTTLLPLFQAGVPCPTEGPFLLVYSAPPREEVKWKEDAEHWRSCADLLARKFLEKKELKVWRLMNARIHPEVPVPTITVEPNPKWKRKAKP